MYTKYFENLLKQFGIFLRVFCIIHMTIREQIRKNFKTQLIHPLFSRRLFRGLYVISPTILATSLAKVYNNPMDLLKKLIYQSWHRGTRENDLLLGSFADAILPTLCEVDLDAYQKMLHHEDVDLFAWITGQRSIPDNEPMVHRIREFHQCR